MLIDHAAQFAADVELMVKHDEVVRLAVEAREKARGDAVFLAKVERFEKEAREAVLERIWSTAASRLTQ